MSIFPLVALPIYVPTSEYPQLFGLKNWVRGFEVIVKDPSTISLRQVGDGLQMPGIFMLANGEIKESFIHKSASDRPNYETLVSCCIS